MKIDHIAIAVNDVEESAKIYQQALGVDSVEFETVETEGVKVAIIHLENGRVELMQPTNENSPIAKFIEKKGEGIHHIAFAVEDIYQEIERLKSSGYCMVHDKPKKGADNKIIAFLHPKSTNGVLIELCQDIED